MLFSERSSRLAAACRPGDGRVFPVMSHAVMTLLLLGGMSATWANDDPPPPALPISAEDAGKQWITLFDGRTLKGWKVTKFGGEGEVRVRDGRLLLEFGNELTGIHTDRKLPRIDYELELEAMRVDGSDFFCGLTFPVGKDPCSLIVGGWGGGVVGLSSIDGYDASENDTTTYRRFDSKRWYRIRLQVTAARIRAWIDGKKIVDQPLAGRKVSIRSEVELSKPLGIASWQTAAALRNIRLRKLSEDEVREAGANSER